MITKKDPLKVNISKLNYSSNSLKNETKLSVNQSLLNRSISSIFQMTQKVIKFINTEINQVYQINMGVRNISQRSQKFKIKKPQSSNLIISWNRQGNLAPGLQAKITVTLKNQENKVIVDKMTIISQNNIQQDIAILVYPDAGKLIYDKFLNLGCIKVGQIKEIPYLIKNTSQNCLNPNFILSKNNSKCLININPVSCILKPKENKQIFLSISCSESGDIKESINIQPISLSASSIDIVATFCELYRGITDHEGTQIDNITVQPFFAGDSIQTKVFMVNNYPSICDFRISHHKDCRDEENDSIMTPQLLAQDNSQKLVNFTPSQGTIEPYCSVQLITEVKSRLDESQQQSFCNFISGKLAFLPHQEKQYYYSLKIYLNSEQNPHFLAIKGISLIPKLRLSSVSCDFGEVGINNKVQKCLKLENLSSLPVKIILHKTSNYCFTPQKLTLKEHCSVKLRVQFCPKIVGKLNQLVHMEVGHFSFPIKLQGKGKFDNRKQTNTLDVQEIQVCEIDKQQIENQISVIGDEQKKFQIEDNTNKSIIHFDYQNSTLDRSLLQYKVEKKHKIIKNKYGKQVKVDLNNLEALEIIQQYSGTARNQQEQRTIMRQLLSQEMKNIIVGPVTIKIGKIFLKSITKKVFNICNFNQKSISIQLDIKNQYVFQESSTARQILLPQSYAGLNIVFYAEKQGDFKYQLHYILNGKYFFDLIVIGCVIEPILILSKCEIKLNSTEQDKLFQKKQIIYLQNIHNYQVNFTCLKQKDSLFKIQPIDGIVPPNSIKNLIIQCNFLSIYQHGGKIQQILKIKIKYGKNIQLKCISYVHDCLCITKTQQINFKEISISKIYQQKIILKNLSKNATIFKIQIDKELEGILSCNGQINSLVSEEMNQLVFKLSVNKPTIINSTVSIVIRGCKPIVLPVKAHIIIPKIRVQNKQLDFGATPVGGNPSNLTAFLHNESNIYVDLQFRLQKDSELIDCLKLISLGKQGLVCIETKQTKLLRSTYLRISPSCKTSFSLQFTPNNVCEQKFMLPLFISNSNDVHPELQRLCTCRGIKNRLMTSEKQVNFGKIIIEPNLETCCKYKTIQLKNPQQQSISWWVEQQNLYPFVLEQTKGILQGYDKIQLRFQFHELNAGYYEKEVHFFIDKVDMNSCYYLKIALKASANYPTIYFNQPYLILPVVPIHHETSTLLQIYNGGYENINIKHMIPKQFQHIGIAVQYLNGPNLGITKKKTTVKVTFSSEKPISFTAILNFYDNSTKIYSIPVSGTTDSCLFTLIQDPKMSDEKQIDRNCSFLKYYINSLGSVDDSIYQFPRSLIQNDFQKLHNLLCLYSSNYEKVRTTIRKAYKQQFNYEYLCEIIKIIKAEGGFLNHIRPEFLISLSEYEKIIFLNCKEQENTYSYYNKFTQDKYNLHQKKSWIIFLYQIFKVYSRVSTKKHKSFDFWTKFSSREKILINWLQQTYLNETRSQQTRKNGCDILAELNDGEIFSALIEKYTNIKIIDNYLKGTKKIKDKDMKCKNVIDIFNQIGINCHCRAEDMIRSNPKQMLLVIEGLYLVLPSYLQKGDPVIFSCAFGQCLTKSIQITNPSKFPIIYVAKIEGCKAYMLDSQPEFLIQSKKTHEVKIRYISNINLNNQSATLTLMGKTSGKITPSTFIFVLKNVCLGRISQKNIQVQGQLYQQYEFSIKVSNNLGKDGNFKIQIIPQNSLISFHVLSSSIKIKKNETVSLNVLFLPFKMQTHKNLIIFRDQKVGLFQYEIIGLVDLPLISCEVLKIPGILLTNQKCMIQLIIPHKNDLLIKARKSLELILDKIDKKKQQLINIKNYDKYYNRIQNENYIIKIQPQNNMILIKNQQIFIKDTQILLQEYKDQIKIQLDIQMTIAIKQGSFFITLKNNSCTDLRKYKVIINSTYKPLRYSLKMNISVNKSLVQILPIINVTNQINIFHVTICHSEQNKSAFTIDCEKQVKVIAKSQQIINLLFRPKLQENYKSILKIDNITTGQLVEYELLGLGDQPEAQQINYEQNCRQEKQYKIQLPVVKNMRCQVIKCTINDMKYTKICQLKSQNPYFKFIFYPKFPGKYEGRLHLLLNECIYAYSMNINVNDIIQNQLIINTIERKKITIQIPLKKGYYTSITNDNNLIIQKQFNIQKTNSNYKFDYYSIKPIIKQSKLILINQQLGKFTYLCKIQIQQMPQIKLETFKVQLGKQQYQQIIFQNQNLSEMKIIGYCTNNEIFSFYPQKIIVQPKSQFKAKIIYRPSSLELQQAKINFISDQNCKWNYHVSGYGLIQSKPIIKQIHTIIGQQICQQLNFINPLNKNIQVIITLKNNEGQNSFEIIMKQIKVQISARKSLCIPIKFRPKQVINYTAILTISTINDKLSWKYKLLGLTTAIINNEQEIIIFKLSCRIKHQQIISFKLPYLCKNTLNQIIKLDIQSNQLEQLHPAIKNVFQINQFQCIQNDTVFYHLNLFSLKPFTSSFYFKLSTSNNCKWLQKAQVIFTVPPIDDSFQIISNINISTAVSFKLNNRHKNHSKFKAYFTPQSNMEFSINPRFGTLQPLGCQGTIFTVTFAPTQYKKHWQGKLIIQTSENYWSYEVKGNLPHYIPPSKIKQNKKA